MKQIMFLRLGTKLCVRTLAPKAWSKVQQGPNDSQFKHTLTTVNTAYKWLCSRLSHMCHVTPLFFYTRPLHTTAYVMHHHLCGLFCCLYCFQKGWNPEPHTFRKKPHC